MLGLLNTVSGVLGQSGPLSGVAGSTPETNTATATASATATQTTGSFQLGGGVPLWALAAGLVALVVVFGRKAR